MEEVIVTVSPQGDVKVSVNGVKGKSCKSLTKNLEAALGDVESTKETREYHEPEARVVNRNRAGR